MTLTVTNVNVHKTVFQTPSALRAIVSVTLNDGIAIHGVKVLQNQEENYFIAMPNEKKADGSFKDIVHPINSAARALIEKAVLEEYNRKITADAAMESIK